MESHKLGVGAVLFVWRGGVIGADKLPPPLWQKSTFCLFGHIFGPDLLAGVLQEAYSKSQCNMTCNFRIISEIQAIYTPQLHKAE